jgi:hypothetical protein
VRDHGDRVARSAGVAGGDVVRLVRGVLAAGAAAGGDSEHAGRDQCRGCGRFAWSSRA